MDPVFSPAVAAALARVAHEREPHRVARALARALPPELARRAAELHALRLRAAARFGADAPAFATARGLEQASHPRAARWRAETIVAALGRDTWVLDATAGIGSDALALARAGLRVVAADRDPWHAACAAANLRAAGFTPRVLRADAERPGARASVLVLDPDRRPDGRRSLDPARWSPSFDACVALARRFEAACVKLAPAFDPGSVPAPDSHAPGSHASGSHAPGSHASGSHASGSPALGSPALGSHAPDSHASGSPAPELHEPGLHAAAARWTSQGSARWTWRWTWTSVHGQLHECTLWTGALAPVDAARYEAVVLGREGGEARLAGEPRSVAPLDPDAAEAASFVADPDPAVVRSGLLGLLAHERGLAPLAPHLGYLGAAETPSAADLAVLAGLASLWRVVASAPCDARRVRAMLGEHDVGRVQVGKRGHSERAEVLERRLRGPGRRAGHLLIARLERGHRAYLVEPATGRP